jgi:hypothetical protein
MSLDAIDHNISQMAERLAAVHTGSLQIGKAGDGVKLRADLETEVRALMNLADQTHAILNTHSDRDSPRFSAVQDRFNSLTSDLNRELPPVVSALRNHPIHDLQAIGPGQYTSGAALDQRLLDEDTETLEVLEQEVNRIVVTMREINSLFNATFEELQRQRTLLTRIDTFVEFSRSDLADANSEMRLADQDQRKDSRCCCIWIIAGVIGVIVALVAIYLITNPF